MFPQRRLHLALALLIYATISFANSPNAHLQHRDHVPLNRLMKKRQVFAPLGGAAAAPPPIPSTGTSSGSLSAFVEPSSTITPTSVTASHDSGLIPGLTSLLGAGTSLPAEVSVGVTTTSSTSESAKTTSQTATTTTPPQLSTTIIKSKPLVTVTTSAAAEDTPTPKPMSAAAKTKSTTLTVLIIVAASVACITILWTIFRKWKLGRSSKFDERMNPIDFQPTTYDDGVLPGAHRRFSGSSFHSGANAPGYPSNSINPLPEHDFTAGPATFAPVGGYADLTRGGSPKPQMQQVNYGASAGYEAGVPLHHQTPYPSDHYDPSGRRY